MVQSTFRNTFFVFLQILSQKHIGLPHSTKQILHQNIIGRKDHGTIMVPKQSFTYKHTHTHVAQITPLSLFCQMLDHSLFSTASVMNAEYLQHIVHGAVLVSVGLAHQRILDDQVRGAVGCGGIAAAIAARHHRWRLLLRFAVRRQ